MGAIYGKLYNWYAVNDPRGLAPTGWHVPSDDEWTILTNYLGIQDGGFEALLGGYRIPGGYFTYEGTFIFLWSSSVLNVEDAWECRFGGMDGWVILSDDKRFGFSVRLVKD
jgi:hypothetical protein